MGKLEPLMPLGIVREVVLGGDDGTFPVLGSMKAEIYARSPHQKRIIIDRHDYLGGFIRMNETSSDGQKYAFFDFAIHAPDARVGHEPRKPCRGIVAHIAPQLVAETDFSLMRYRLAGAGFGISCGAYDAGIGVRFAALDKGLEAIYSSIKGLFQNTGAAISIKIAEGG